MVRLNYFNTFPTEISISMSSICNAQCVWCPIGRGLNTSNKSEFISVAIADKVLKDIEGKRIEQIFFADMGEPLLNPDFKEIVTKFRLAHPEAAMWLSSNFFLMDDAMAHTVLDLGFDAVGLDIDGITEEGYYAVKRLPLNVVFGNLVNFVGLREAKLLQGIKIPIINVSVVTQPRYYMEIGEPEKMTVPDETRQAVTALRGLLEYWDTITASTVISWAERRRWNRPRTRANGLCSNIHVVGKKCCIDTDGNVISCCQDFDSELKFGNVMDSTISEIWNGEKRKEFLKAMFEFRFADIGLPCANCQD